MGRPGHQHRRRRLGADLRREMKWLGSYRYGVFNLGAPTLEELFARFERLCREITFHPRGQRLSEAAPATLALGDD